MAKGIFSQGVCLLTDGQKVIEDIKSALQEQGFEVVKQTPPQKDWCFGGPTLVLAIWLITTNCGMTKPPQP